MAKTKVTLAVLFEGKNEVLRAGTAQIILQYIPGLVVTSESVDRYGRSLVHCTKVWNGKTKEYTILTKTR